MGRRQDPALARAARAHARALRPLLRAIRRRRRAVLPRRAAARGARRLQPRSDRRSTRRSRSDVERGDPAARACTARRTTRRHYYETRDAVERSRRVVVDAGARGDVHLPQQDLLQRPVAREPLRRFNVPIGRYTDPPICVPDALRAAHAVLARAELRCARLSRRRSPTRRQATSSTSIRRTIR